MARTELDQVTESENVESEAAAVVVEGDTPARKRRRSRAARGLGARPQSLRWRELERAVRWTREEIADEPEPPEPPPSRPRTRGDCERCATCEEHLALDPRPAVEVLTCGHRASEALNHCRPCVRVSCRHHTYLDISPSGHLRMTFPDKEVDELQHTCSLDVADDVADGREITLEDAGVMVNLTRERVRIIQDQVLTQITTKHGRRLRGDEEPGDVVRPPADEGDE